MRITVTSLLVDNQSNALAFYTDVLGFLPKVDIPVGGEDRWLTVVPAEDPEGIQLLLEPNSNPAVPAQAYQRSLFEAGIPATSFTVDNVQAEYERLLARGVQFTTPPTTDEGSGVTMAVFDDTCGNLIMIASA